MEHIGVLQNVVLSRRVSKLGRAAFGETMHAFTLLPGQIGSRNMHVISAPLTLAAFAPDMAFKRADEQKRNRAR